MEVSFYLSACAISVSLISLVWSIHIGRRDHGKLKATSKLYYSGPESDVQYLQVRAVNHGRRPVILRMLGLDFGDGSWEGIYLKDGGLRLGENEVFEKDIRVGDSYSMSHECEEAIGLWFEDTLGRRYRVKNAKENLEKLWGRNEEH